VLCCIIVFVFLVALVALKLDVVQVLLHCEGQFSLLEMNSAYDALVLQRQPLLKTSPATQSLAL